MPYTIKDIARAAEVSTATVSRVANGAVHVSDKTRARVLSTFSTFQYCPNAHASALGRRNGKAPSKHRNDKQSPAKEGISAGL